VIVVLVHKPEDVLTPDVTPFEGTTVHGIYYEAEIAGVSGMVENLMNEHPDWAFKVVSNIKISVGFSVPQAPKPQPRNKR
jgi:hypothetical protein